MCLAPPTWFVSIGLEKVDPDHNSLGVELFWGAAKPANFRNQIFYNIYYSGNRFGVFSDGPRLITTARDVVVPIVLPGDINYFAVRATEFDPTFFDITQLQQVGSMLYQYPQKQQLLNSMDAYTSVVDISSTFGFPTQGFLLVETEVIEYTSITSNSFIIPVAGRGAYLTTPMEHSIDAYVSLFHGVEDGNSFIHRGVRDWSENQTPYIKDSYGQANADIDGYRAALEDNLTGDFSSSDASNLGFDELAHCGYQRPTIFEVLNGLCNLDGSGTFLNSGSTITNTTGVPVSNGGVTIQPGQSTVISGFNFQDALNGRLNDLLSATGEPIILLRRKWTGRRCRCIDLRRENARFRCPTCFGTGFEGGYDRYINPRSISQAFVNTAGFIMIRVSPAPEVLKLEDKQSLRQDTTLAAWTLTVPTLKQRDVVIRYNPGTFVEEFRYEVMPVTRNRTLFTQEGRQDFNLYRMDKTDAIYTYKII